MAIVLFLSLAALALASSAYLGTTYMPVKPSDKSVLSSIAPLYRQISAQAGQDAPAYGSARRAAVDTPFAAAFLRVDEYPEGADASVTMETDSAASDLPLGVTVSRLGGRWSTFSTIRRMPTSQDLSGTAALVFNNSFSSLFSKLFDPQADESNRNADITAENRNPFAEIKQKEDASRRAEADSAQAPKDRRSQETQPAASSPASGQEAPIASRSGTPPERFVFLGDFDGSGMLSVLTAERAGELSFAFADGTRTFNLFINASAVESQKSLALEDVDGDGIMDLLVTARAGLFGRVLTGDGEGSYHLAHTFLTGWEPVLVAVGPKGEAGRAIVTVNTRSGEVTTFRPGRTYERSSTAKLDFRPDYITHIVELETEADYLEVARTGREPRLYRWPAGGDLERRAATLPAEPSLQIGPDPNFGSQVGSIRIYQVGEYASVVLANTAGRAFNVANLKISPQACLVFGDLEGRGNLDVGVANLVSFTPSK